MPLYFDGAIAECFHCHAKVGVRLTLIPTTSRRPPLPKKWAYFQENLDERARRQFERPRDEVFCPKHFPSKGWRRLDNED